VKPQLKKEYEAIVVGKKKKGGTHR